MNVEAKSRQHNGELAFLAARGEEAAFEALTLAGDGRGGEL